MSSDEKKVVKLGSSVIQKASLKMQRWKEIKAARKRGGFGSIVRGGKLTTTPASDMTLTRSDLNQYRKRLDARFRTDL
jgi:hypothetical protein